MNQFAFGPLIASHFPVLSSKDLWTRRDQMSKNFPTEYLISLVTNLGSRQSFLIRYIWFWNLFCATEGNFSVLWTLQPPQIFTYPLEAAKQFLGKLQKFFRAQIWLVLSFQILEILRMDPSGSFAKQYLCTSLVGTPQFLGVSFLGKAFRSTYKSLADLVATPQVCHHSQETYTACHQRFQLNSLIKDYAWIKDFGRLHSCIAASFYMKDLYKWKKPIGEVFTKWPEKMSKKGVRLEAYSLN